MPPCYLLFSAYISMWLAFLTEKYMVPFQGLIQGTAVDGVAISTLLYAGYYGKMSIIASHLSRFSIVK